MANTLLERKRWSEALTRLKIESNPSDSELRILAHTAERTADFGAPAYATRLATVCDEQNTVIGAGEETLGRFQTLIEPKLARRVVEQVKSRMMELPWLSLDRTMGSDPDASFHCRLLIPPESAQAACIWSKTLRRAPQALRDPAATPDFLTVYFPFWLRDASEEASRLPRQLVLVYPDTGITFVLGFDSVEPLRMSFLRQAMYRAKRLGGLGLCAASKLLRVVGEDGPRDCGMLIVGPSGLQKTMLALDGHGLTQPEGADVLQNDIVLMNPEGRAYGTEENFFVPTEGITSEDHPALRSALTVPEAAFENVALDPEGALRLGTTSGSPGRAVAPRSRIPRTTDSIDLGRVEKIVLLTHRRTVVPPVARLSRELAAAFFMLGERVEDSGKGTGRGGRLRRTVGFNPAIVGLEDEEGNRLLELLRANPSIETYLLNTGRVGKRADAPGRKARGTRITSEVMSKILLFIARQEPGVKEGWERDRDFNEVPASVPDIPEWSSLKPESHYRASTFFHLTQDLRHERREWLEQFTDLDPKIPAAIGGD